MTAHVFVVQGDLTKLTCDHWLLPTDRGLKVEPAWHEAAAIPPELVDPRGRLILDAGWPKNSRVRKFRELGASSDQPQPWLVDVGADAHADASWFAEGASAFLQAAASEPLPEDRPRFGRARALLALPLLGTGSGGARAIKGEVLECLMRALLRAPEYVDVVLVTRGPAAFAAAQAMRRRLASPVGLWAEVDEFRDDAKVLAEDARAGNLVTFLGAGASAAAGLPLWGELLDKLAIAAQLDEAERAQFDKLDVLDQARVLEARLHGREQLATCIIEMFEGARPALAHYLLANLPVQETATTNYDRLFEIAARETGRPVAVLPWEGAAAKGGRWLLKLHGSVDHPPKDIVLTRDDYLSYGERRAALSGIVQSLLITRHMLFVGFGLEDDNFHRILHEVRNAVGDPAMRLQSVTFGTVLTLEDKPLGPELWRGDLRHLSLRADSTAEAARRMELFLDLVLSEVSDTSSHLLDESFASMLDEAENTLAEAFRKLADTLARQGVSEHPTAAPAVALVRMLGGEVMARDGGMLAASLVKGSKQRMRELVDQRQVETDKVLTADWATLRDFKKGPLRWLSPVASSGYGELRDDMWVRADLPPPTPQVEGFWPHRGPVWDGVAVVPGEDGGHGVLLVEAKSHAQELKSPGTSAAGESRRQIDAALAATKNHLGVASEKPWAGSYYQIANRLSFLYYLRVVRRLPAWLLFVYFIGDTFSSGQSVIRGPSDASGWTAPIAEAENALGLPAEHALTPWIFKHFLPVS